MARTYRHLDLDDGRTLFRLIEGLYPADGWRPDSAVTRPPSTASRAETASATATGSYDARRTVTFDRGGEFAGYAALHWGAPVATTVRSRAAA